MENKRRFPRAEVQLDSSIRTQTSILIHNARVKDISECGICLQLKQHFGVGTALFVKIRLKFDANPITAPARVVRVGRGTHKLYPFDTGLDFVQLQPADRDRIRLFALDAHKNAPDDHQWQH